MSNPITPHPPVEAEKPDPIIIRELATLLQVLRDGWTTFRPSPPTPLPEEEAIARVEGSRRRA